MRLILVFLACALVVGCSNRAVYDNIQLNQQNECFKLPPSQREDCLDSIDKSYDEYRKEREEVTGEESAA